MVFEFIIGGLVVAGLGYLAYRFKNRNIVDLRWNSSKLRLELYKNKKKLVLSDAQELYVMVLESIRGGDDGAIDSVDALVLLNKLQGLVRTKKRGY